MKQRWIGWLVLILLGLPGLNAQSKQDVGLQLEDIFQLEWGADPRISPDGKTIVYVRSFMDIMTDQRRSNLWTIHFDGSGHRPLTTGNQNDHSPRWSPDGSKLLYVSTSDGSSQVYVRWMDTGQTAKLTNLAMSPSGLRWSPDGRQIAFTMFVPSAHTPFVSLPGQPAGAQWAPAAKVIQKLQYRADGAGYLPDGFQHLFVLSADGGTPRQLTDGDFNHGSTHSWTPDAKYLLFSANRHKDWLYDPNNTEVYELTLADGSIRALTDRKGPDNSPAVSPDGLTIAYLGFDDRFQGYQITRLYTMNRDGSNPKVISADFDRGIADLNWAQDGRSLYFQYDAEGNGKIGTISLGGQVTTLTGNAGGLSLGRPYGAAQYSVAPGGQFAFTQSRPDYPADVAAGRETSDVRRLTRLNDDLFSFRKPAEVTEIWYQSSYDGRRIQGWIAKPPDFDANRKYPLLLEIHGGPFTNYGDRFAAEIQLYAAAGYVVLYTNPRGSTSYGEEFGNLIHHNYPSQDYDDLISGVDAVIAQGYVDPSRLFVTGGSGGGVLTSWIVGKTDRFKAAVVQKPVINWYSFVLTADAYNFFYKYWFPGFPWDHLEHYMSRSPISLVGNVTTPTMVLTGESDYRTPMSESEQYYQALQLRKVPSALVRIPGASHGIATRPSNLMAKVAHILKWFELHDGQ